MLMNVVRANQSHFSRNVSMNDAYVAATTGCLKGRQAAAILDTLFNVKCGRDRPVSVNILARRWKDRLTRALSLTENSFLNLNKLKELEPKRDEITKMVFGNGDQTEILFTTAGREIHAFDTTNIQQRKLFGIANGSEKINGLYLTQNDQVVVSDGSGSISLLDRRGEELCNFKGGQGLLCLHGDGDRIAVGGKACPAKVFHLEKPEAPVWISKNVPPDNLQLQVPIWDTDIRLIPNSETLVTGTGTHVVRMYDLRAQRRPVRQAEWMETPITALSLSYRDHQLFAGNTLGELALFDLRGKTRIMMVCKFKGQSGAIRSIYGHPTAPYVASCGIDRFVRLHDVATKKLVSKIYCKARLNCVLLRDSLSVMKSLKKEIEVDADWDQIKREEEAENSDSDDDESIIWDQIGDEQDSGSDEKDSLDDDDESDTTEVYDESEEESPPPSKKRKVIPTKKSSVEIKEEENSENDEVDAKKIQQKQKVSQGSSKRLTSKKRRNP